MMKPRFPEKFQNGIDVNDLMTPGTDIKFKDYEDGKCRYVVDKLGDEDAFKYDTVRNYILVNNQGGTTNECYIKNTDVEIDGNCSKSNPDIYDDKFRNIVSDIYPKLQADSYVAKTLPEDVCVIKFTNNDVSKDNIHDYMTYLDYNLPKLQIIRKQIADDKKEEDRLQIIINNLNDKLKRLTDYDGSLLNTINDLNQQIASLQNDINNLKTIQIPQAKANIQARAVLYQNEANLAVLACDGVNFANCVSFPVGRYDVREMEVKGLGNDSLSSIKVPPGLVARLYSDNIDQWGDYPDGNNKYIEIDGRDVSWIGNEKWMDGTQDPPLNDSTSSIMVFPKPVA